MPAVPELHHIAVHVTMSQEEQTADALKKMNISIIDNNFFLFCIG
jgi:hypothetical protein